MLAKKLPQSDELPTRPFNTRPTPQPEDAPISGTYPISGTHLMLVRAPRPTARSLAWARHQGAQAFDAAALESMLRLERLNLG